MIRVECGKSVKLYGGFSYTVRTARDNYRCFFCGGIIPRGGVHVEERFASVVRRYHYECLNRVLGGRVRAVETPAGVLLCRD